MFLKKKHYENVIEKDFYGKSMEICGNIQKIT